MFTIGADPEIFAIDENNEHVSVIDRMPGTKDEPFDIEVGAIQVDNVACEFNTKPTSTPEEFSSAVAAPLKVIERLLAEQGLSVSDVAYAKFNEEQLSDFRAFEVGCEPDFCAYTGEINIPPDLFSTQYRSGAGHVHVGLDIEEEKVPFFVKILDLTLAIPSLELETPERRELYGKAGCFRYKPYGVEYRTPSNHWVFRDSRRRWIFKAVQRAVEFFKKGIEVPNELQEVINNNDIKRAKELVRQYKLETCPVV